MRQSVLLCSRRSELKPPGPRVINNSADTPTTMAIGFEVKKRLCECSSVREQRVRYEGTTALCRYEASNQLIPSDTKLDTREDPT